MKPFDVAHHQHTAGWDRPQVCRWNSHVKSKSKTFYSSLRLASWSQPIRHKLSSALWSVRTMEPVFSCLITSSINGWVHARTHAVHSVSDTGNLRAFIAAGGIGGLHTVFSEFVWQQESKKLFLEPYKEKKVTKSFLLKMFFEQTKNIYHCIIFSFPISLKLIFYSSGEDPLNRKSERCSRNINMRTWWASFDTNWLLLMKGPLQAHHHPWLVFLWIISVALLHGKPFLCFVACSDFNLSQCSSTQTLKLLSQVLMHHLYQYSLWLRCIELVLHPNFWNYICIREKCWYANRLLAIFLIFCVIFYMTHLNLVAHLNWLKTG